MNAFRALLLIATTCGVSGASAQAVSVSEIEARLFLAHTGTLSEPLSEGHGLWNTVIGEGNATEPSSSTLVKVVVLGPPKSFNKNAVVVLTVTSAKSKAMLAKHREVPFCASCHERFDSFGLAYEGYGPVGDVRSTDLAGRPVDTAVVYPGAVSVVNVNGGKPIQK